MTTLLNRKARPVAPVKRVLISWPLFVRLVSQEAQENNRVPPMCSKKITPILKYRKSLSKYLLWNKNDVVDSSELHWLYKQASHVIWRSCHYSVIHTLRYTTIPSKCLSLSSCFNRAWFIDFKLLDGATAYENFKLVRCDQGDAEKNTKMTCKTVNVR